MGNGRYYFGEQSGQGEKGTVDLHLVSKLRICGAKTPRTKPEFFYH
jgi:hypothetical protein